MTPDSRPRAPLLPLFLLIIYVLGGLMVGNFLGLAVTSLLFGYGLEDVVRLTSAPEELPNSRVALLLLQGFSAGCAFLLAPWLYLKFSLGKKVSELSTAAASPLLLTLGLAAALALLAIPFNGWLHGLNQQIELPAALAGLEAWAKDKETQLEQLTLFLTNFSHPGEYLLALVVIAVLPAVGEELVFRGLMQPLLVRWTGRVHVGIWLTAVIFSFFHFQFYGFLPRTFLGALFGYLYLWSGQLWAPIAAHFVNNATTVTLIYLGRLGLVPFAVEDDAAVPWSVGLLSAAITVILLIRFRQNHRGTTAPGHQWPAASERL